MVPSLLTIGDLVIASTTGKVLGAFRNGGFGC